jgi:hypothetical protein
VILLSFSAFSRTGMPGISPFLHLAAASDWVASGDCPLPTYCSHHVPYTSGAPGE